MQNYLIQNGRVIDPANNVDRICDLLIVDEKIKEVGNNLKFENVEVIDARNKVICPGLIDIHVHLREPGREDKETIETALKSALMGGFSSVLSMPNTSPSADNQTVIEYQLSKARKLRLAKLYVSGTITRDGNRISEMREMKLTGAVAVTDDGSDVQNESLFKHALEWAKTFDLPVFCHAEIENLSGNGCMHEGFVSAELGLPGIPRSAEDLAIIKAITLAEEVGHHIHITHVSTESGVDAVRRAKEKGIHITSEATPHHFALTHEECRGWNTDAKMYPPLREESDRIAVIAGLADGTIDTIASDHAPHLENEKFMPFIDAPKGTVGLETTLGVSLEYLLHSKSLTLPQIIAKMTINPAKLLNIDAGTLSVGSPADVMIFDPEKEWTVDPRLFASKGKNSAFKGKTLRGKPEYIWVDGVLNVKNGVLI